MKKKVISFAVFGTILAVVGGVGGAIYFPKAEKQSRTSIDERYQVKKNTKNLELSVKGNIRYQLYESPDQDVHVSGQAHSVTTKQSFDFQPRENGDKTAIDVAFTETGDYREYVQLGFSQYVEIAIPASFETITINSTQNSQVEIDNLKTKELVLNADSHDYSNLRNLRVDNLTVNAQAGRIHLSDIKAQKTVTMKGEQGDFTISNSRAEKFAIHNTDGYISLSELTGNSQVQTTGGFVTLSELKGKTAVETVDGDIDWEHSKIIDDLTIKTSTGDIRVNLERQPSNFSIATKNDNGTVRLFGKERASMKKGTGNPTLTLESLHGDIRVYDEDSEYDEYDETFDETFSDVENDVIDAIEENL